jgi:hypothetical protein
MSLRGDKETAENNIISMAGERAPLRPRNSVYTAMKKIIWDCLHTFLMLQLQPAKYPVH